MCLLEIHHVLEAKLRKFFFKALNIHTQLNFTLLVILFWNILFVQKADVITKICIIKKKIKLFILNIDRHMQIRDIKKKIVTKEITPVISPKKK